MQADIQYTNLTYQPPERQHKYGKNVHLIQEPYLLTLISELSRPETKQPRFNRLVTLAYRSLFQIVASSCLRRKQVEHDTRMLEFNKEGRFSGELIARDQKVVLVDLARAGILPTLEGFDFFCSLLEPDNVRIDHIFISRATNEAKEVVGADVAGVKIGGPIEGSLLIIPDPMAATGSSIIETLELYQASVGGKPTKAVLLNLIATSEAIQHVLDRFPETEIFTVRLDRGLSDAEVLKTLPGTHKERERGLNDNQYIVPGAGGLGELMTHSFV